MLLKASLRCAFATAVGVAFLQLAACADYCICDHLAFGATTGAELDPVPFSTLDPLFCARACESTPTCNNFLIFPDDDTCYLISVIEYTSLEYSSSSQYIGLAGSCESYPTLPSNAGCQTQSTLIPSGVLKKRNAGAEARRERRIRRSKTKCDMC